MFIAIRLAPVAAHGKISRGFVLSEEVPPTLAGRGKKEDSKGGAFSPNK